MKEDLKQTAEPQQSTCPSGCCTGNEILCISIPCPINIVLLGLNLTLELPCVRLTSSTPLTAPQINQLVQPVAGIISSLGTSIKG
ncbi:MULTISPECIES: hypothetical protein [Clostridium]|uniref:Uncharacterized protein n=4 Tax=Clostridium TaxID=1485 RepID=D8GMZ2_CLOLD|nr:MULTISPECIES: hypothetical protein [Clostridium]ADK15780.1 hypothetical protein CLJU_c27220 [Clostridium ljungdahlii DSM 13528]AGY75034.1 hypothetical protein CAETHG_0807 [Clostridium autoethanogenum DSM 10061]ALU35208.1 Hypothetical protein CLAU_0779 [Clostridium autoethanogenum DSM 10061]OAA86410.1 hypothetical protein WX45_04074 [Clostridium ljungdahlii DSM 13528]OAA90998.1 hypothetical protein WX73_01909 [Clostridium coskatii]